MAMFWFASGISSSLFAATVTDKYAAGAEPAQFALMTALVGMYIYYWNRIGSDDDWCCRVCGLFMMIFLLVIGIFFLTSFAAPYKNYAKLYSIAYPDTSGFIGGFLFGLPLSWVFMRPTGGSMKQATGREKCLLLVGLIWSVILFIIIASAFSLGDAPKDYWHFE